MTQPTPTAPLTDSIIIALSRMVDDSQSDTREPSHSDIEFQIKRSNLEEADPKARGQLVGKAKRVRGTLSWALEHQPSRGMLFVEYLLSLIRGCGGFRDTSPNYVGENVIEDAIEAFKAEGFQLSYDGQLRPILLDNLSGAELTDALNSYVRRAKIGASDAALVTGTGKDLLEATAAHVLTEKWGGYSAGDNFPTLLGQAFVALGLYTPQNPRQSGEAPARRLERSMYELGCAINFLRNKEGTGHGRPWLPSVTQEEAKAAIEFMGVISERLLSAL